MPSSGSQAPTLPPGPCAPHVSPSTSALSLVLSHRLEEEERHLLGLIYTTSLVEEGAGEEAGHPQPWDLGAPCTPKLKLLLEPQLTGSAAAMLPLLSLLCCSDCCDQPCFKHV